MFAIINIIFSEKYHSARLFGTALFGKFFDFLFCMPWLFITCILFTGLTQSCSSKKVVNSLKKLQVVQEESQAPIIDLNQTVAANNIKYPIFPHNHTALDNDYTIETFLILLLLVIFFSFPSSGFFNKLFSLFKKK